MGRSSIHCHSQAQILPSCLHWSKCRKLQNFHYFYKKDLKTAGGFQNWKLQRMPVDTSLCLSVGMKQFHSSCKYIYVYLFQMKPSRLKLFLSTFISISLYVSGNYVPIIRRAYCIYTTPVFFPLYGWLSGLLQTRQPPVQSEKYQCRIATVSSPDDGHIVDRNM